MTDRDTPADTPPGATENTSAHRATGGEEALAEQTVLEQLGGVSGLVYSTLPVLVFVPVNAVGGLTVAIWSAVAIAVVILVVRLVRHEPVQPAITGFLGVGLSAFIAHRTGNAKGFFLFGIYTSLLYGGVFLVSILIRWPLVGVVWGFLNGGARHWRGNRAALRAYDIATAGWVAVFAARYLVQSELYDSDRTGWLAVARLAMGWPLAAIAFALTVWAVRRADAAIDAAGTPAAGIHEVQDGTDAQAGSPSAERS